MNYEERIADPIVGSIGEFGKWQLLLYIVVFAEKFPVGWHQLAILFLAPPIEFSCVKPNNETDKCSAECTEIEFDRTIFKETIITEWKLVCEHKYLATLSQTIFMFGILVGNLVFGLWSDSKGRRPALVCAMSLQFICGVLSATVKWFWAFTFLRFLVGVATGGSMLTSFVLLMESTGKKHRESVSILCKIPFNIGHATLPLFSYYLREWRKFYLTISSISAAFISYYWLVPESPRWLLTMGYLDRSAKILEKAATINKLPTQNIRSDLEEAARRRALTPGKKKGTVLDLFRSRNLCINTICMSYNWFAIGLSYYGVSQYIGTLSGDIFINVAISACLTIPGTFLVIPMTRHLGRKPTLIITNTSAAICLFAIALLSKKVDPGLIVILASIGLCGAWMGFPNVYLYAGELYPTVVRNAGIGVSSMVARWGTMIAPFITTASDIVEWLPPVIFGVALLLGTFLTLFLPETKGCFLPETIEDGEAVGRK